MQIKPILISSFTAMIANQPATKKPQIQIKRIYKHGIDKVWLALTTKEALSEWLMSTSDFELEIGTRFQFKTKPQGNFDGIVNGKLLAFEKPHFISYSWQATSMKNPTTVSWKLQALSEQETILTLSHTGFEGISGWITKQILNFGWKGMLRKKLEKFLQR